MTTGAVTYDSIGMCQHLSSWNMVHAKDPFSFFLLVMDPLLRQFQSVSSGLSVDNAYIFLHADDICTFADSLTSLKSIVAKFISENFSEIV